MRKPRDIFSDYITESGLKNTAQRRLIADVFFKSGKHLSTEELYNVVRGHDENIGQATVYRTLKLLRDAGLAHEHHFGENTARFEPVEGDSHHDHLICISCGKNLEVVDQDIELLQEKLARRNGFMLTSHRMTLHGICGDCTKKGRKGRNADL